MTKRETVVFSLSQSLSSYSISSHLPCQRQQGKTWLHYNTNQSIEVTDGLRATQLQAHSSKRWVHKGSEPSGRVQL